MIEQLESRRLLAVTASFTGGVLTVTGDADANRVSIGRHLDSGTLFVRSGDTTIATVPYADVNQIKVDLLGGNDSLMTASNVAKPMTVLGGDGNDTLTSGGAADSVAGGAGNDVLSGAGGADSLYGGEGHDRLDGGSHGDLLSGGGGIDTVTYASRTHGVRVTLDNVANDGTPATSASPAEGDNVKTDVEKVIGGRGNDYLSAAPVLTSAGTITPGRVTLEGGAGNDTLIGSSGGETTSASPNSALYGGEGNDSLVGGSKVDVLNGGGGNDTLKGNDGHDFLNGGTGADSMSGGGGIDSVSYAERTHGVVVTLDDVANDGTPATSTTLGEGDNVKSDVERVTGGRGNDRLVGNGAANTLGGGEGNDSLYGEGGNDVLEGGHGNDVMYGGSGNDSLYGGPGNDSLYGQDGNDFLHGKDGLADLLDGGSGTEDRASRDAGIDTVTGVEFFVT